jgi:hypothetical protein
MMQIQTISFSCRHLIISEDMVAPPEEGMTLVAPPEEGTTLQFSNTGFACSNPSRDTEFLVSIYFLA